MTKHNNSDIPRSVDNLVDILIPLMKEQPFIDRLKTDPEKALRQKSPLLDLCRDYGLEPEPAGNKETSFTAKCVTGRPHDMYLSTESEEWGCGYCRIKGGVEELKEAYKKYQGK